VLDVGGRSPWKGVGLTEVVDVTAGHEAGSEEGDTTTTSDDAHACRLDTPEFKFEFAEFHQTVPGALSRIIVRPLWRHWIWTEIMDLWWALTFLARVEICGRGRY
jgi:hypothetical protein